MNVGGCDHLEWFNNFSPLERGRRRMNREEEEGEKEDEQGGRRRGEGG